jgi:hypothetical protein
MDDNYSHAFIFYPSTWTSIKCVLLVRLARRQNGYTLTTHTHTHLLLTFVTYLRVVDKLIDSQNGKIPSVEGLIFTMVNIT